MNWTLAGECTMTLLAPGLLYLLLMQMPWFRRAVDRVRLWQHGHDVLDYCDSLEARGGEDIGRR